jgi:hypothetical protein
MMAALFIILAIWCLRELDGEEITGFIASLFFAIMFILTAALSIKSIFYRIEPTAVGEVEVRDGREVREVECDEWRCDDGKPFRMEVEMPMEEDFKIGRHDRCDLCGKKLQYHNKVHFTYDFMDCTELWQDNTY